MHLRPITDADVPTVLQLNESNVEVLSPLDADGLTHLRRIAWHADVVEVDGEVAAFVIVLGPRAEYDSVNYGWFAERYDDFCYLDRVVVAERWRRRGIGKLVYDEVEETARPHCRLTLEVYAEPPNHASLAFHTARGYAEVGRLTHRSGKVTAMLSKDLGTEHGRGPAR